MHNGQVVKFWVRKCDKLVSCWWVSWICWVRVLILGTVFLRDVSCEVRVLILVMRGWSEVSDDVIVDRLGKLWSWVVSWWILD